MEQKQLAALPIDLHHPARIWAQTRTFPRKHFDFKSPMTNKKVLVTAARWAVSLNLSRRMRAAGWDVFVCDSEPSCLSSYSSDVKGFFQTPDLSKNPQGYAECIVDMAEKLGIDCIVPSFEEGFVLSRSAHLLPTRCELFFPEYELAEAVHHKLEFIRLAASIGLKVPFTEKVDVNRPDLPETLQGKPFVVKPVHTRGGHEVKIMPAGETLASIEFDSDRDYLVQEYISGQNVCSFAVVINGRVALNLCYRPLLAVGHVSCAFQGFSQPEVDAFVHKFAAETGFHGFLSFDFRENEAGDIYPIECNPRMTNGLLVTRSDAFRQAFLERVHVSSPAAKTKAGNLFGIIYRLALDIKARKSPLQAIKTLITCRDVISSWRDPMPLLGNLWLYSKLIWQGRDLGDALYDGCTWPPADVKLIPSTLPTDDFHARYPEADNAS